LGASGGDYVIAAGSEARSDSTGACTLPRFYGTVMLTKSGSVPATGMVGACEAALGLAAVGVASIRHRRRAGAM